MSIPVPDFTKLPLPESSPERPMFPPVVLMVVPVEAFVRAILSELFQAVEAARVVAPRFTAVTAEPVLVMPPEPSVIVPSVAVSVPLFTAIELAENVPPERLKAASLPAVPADPVPPLVARVSEPESVVFPAVWL